MLEERKALEVKYHALHVAVWKQRSEVLSGAVDPAASAASSGIPKFWLTAFSNHPAVADFVEERDEEALSALKDVTWDYLPELKVRCGWDERGGCCARDVCRLLSAGLQAHLHLWPQRLL